MRRERSSLFWYLDWFFRIASISRREQVCWIRTAAETGDIRLSPELTRGTSFLCNQPTN